MFKVATAVALSAGLVLGGSVGAFAEESNPTPSASSLISPKAKTPKVNLTQAALEVAKKTIALNFANAVLAANTTYAAAIAAATSDEEKTAARIAFKSAVAAAAAARDQAIAALGAGPTKPGKPAPKGPKSPKSDSSPIALTNN